MRDPSTPSTRFGSVPQPFASKNGSGTELPFEPRQLTRKEERRGDLYLYHSPRLGRTVAVIGVPSLALALELEFDSETTGFVERPRTLSYRDAEIELTFWQQERSGRERFHYFVANASKEIEQKSRRRQHRNARDIIEAANAAGINLQFVFEDEILTKAASIGTWFRLLPFVQTALTLPHRYSVKERLLEALATQPRMTFDQAEAALTGVHPADVRAVACALVHAGTLIIDPTKPLSRHTVVELRSAV